MRRASHLAARRHEACRHGLAGMLPNLRFIAASVVASIALITFGFGLFAAFRIANQSSVVLARANDLPAPRVFAESREEAPAAATASSTAEVVAPGTEAAPAVAADRSSAPEVVARPAPVKETQPIVPEAAPPVAEAKPIEPDAPSAAAEAAPPVT